MANRTAGRGLGAAIGLITSKKRGRDTEKSADDAHCHQKVAFPLRPDV